MKKRLLAGLLVAMMMVSIMTSAAFAAEVESDEAVIRQTLDTVFDYLNSQEIFLGPQGFVEYEIPVGENLVSVTIENTPVVNTLIAPREIILEDKYYDIEWGVSYICTTTINNFYSNSGKVVFKVYYSCTKNEDPSKFLYILNPTDVTIDVTAPSGCSLIESSAWYEPGTSLAGWIIAYGEAKFDRIWPLSDYVFNLEVRIIADGEGRVLVRYQYEK